MSEDQLAQDHSKLDAVLEELFSALAEEDITRSFERLDLFWARLAMHIRAENIHLFPVLLEAGMKQAGLGRETLEAGAVDLQEIVASLRHDHDFFMVELTAVVKELRAASQNGGLVDFKKVSQQIDAVARRLDRHNALEETQVYPLAARLLTPSERDVLNEALHEELERLPARFQ